MLIGLDVGGTHTDAVLLDGSGGAVLASVKVRTDPCDVLPGTLEALGAVLRGRDPVAVRRVCVSSTLGLNALLTGKGERVGMLVVPGPGMNPRLFWGKDSLFRVLRGSQDHRGRIVAPFDEEEARRALRDFAEEGVGAVGVVSKFSPKNAEMEEGLAALARECFGEAVPVVLGARVSGSLNFPRRMHTVWCNAALAGVSRAYVRSLTNSAASLGLSCPVAVLKADAGVFAAEQAALDPASTMGSGPAASLLGVWALDATAPRKAGDLAASADTLMIDMGGTTTDLALLAGGFPLLAPKGLVAAGRPTLIRSLWTRSIALGGDSSLRVEEGTLRIGPDRSGPALALGPEGAGRPPTLPDGGSRPPTLTDAMNALGMTSLGDPALSLAAMRELAEQSGWAGDDGPRALSERFVEEAMRVVTREAKALLEEVNAQPVYTIRELLVSEALAPRRAVCIGGPAKALAAKLRESLGMAVHVPEESAFANAVGAALARPTLAADLYADTLAGRMSIPDFGVEQAIGRGYTLADAGEDMRAAFAEALGGIAEAGEAGRDAGNGLFGGDGGRDVQIVSGESFVMLDDRGGRGRIVRLRAQLAAGLLGVCHDDV